ncbi:MAG: cation:proton antiporter [Thermoplasmata archaeon]|nr:cation:proton antiporter [Thermoplasmata archaeon]
MALFSPISDILLALLILLVLCRMLGLIFERYGISPIVGNVMGGLLLSPLILNLLASDGDLSVFVSFAIIVIMFQSGVFTDFASFKRYRMTSLVVGTMGVVVSFALIFVLSYWGFHFSLEASMLLAAILSNSAIEVCAVMLKDSRNERLRSIVIGASFVDDILAVFVLGVVLSFTKHSSPLPENIVGGTSDAVTAAMDLGFTSVKVIVFLLVTSYVLSLVVGKVLDRFSRKGFTLLLSIGFIFAFGLGILAKWVGLHEVIGVYIAGLLISRWGISPDPMLARGVSLMKFKETLNSMVVSLFSPLFFGFIGIMLGDALSDQGVSQIGVLLLGVLIFTFFALMGKVVGCGIGARMKGIMPKEAMLIGAAMGGRGALELILIRSSTDEGFLNSYQFLILTVVTLMTILLTPVIYRVLKERLSVN